MVTVMIAVMVIVVIANRLASDWIQEQLSVAMLEVKHVEQRAGAFVRRAAADPACAPVVFNEAQDGRLVGQCAINKVRLGESRDNHQRQARTEAAFSLNAARGAGAAIAGAVQAVGGGVGRSNDGRHYVFFFQAEDGIRDDDGDLIPFTSLL